MRQTLGRAQRNWAADYYALPVCSNLQFQASLKISYNKLVTYVRICTYSTRTGRAAPNAGRQSGPPHELGKPFRQEEKKKNSLDRGWIISSEVHVNNLRHDNWGGGVRIYFLLTYSLLRKLLLRRAGRVGRVEGTEGWARPVAAERAELRSPAEYNQQKRKPSPTLYSVQLLCT